LVFKNLLNLYRNSILYANLPSKYVNNAVSLIYLIAWIFLGNYVLLNLFLAILLNSMGDIADEDNKDLIADL
jgi:hypothetical protein